MDNTTKVIVGIIIAVVVIGGGYAVLNKDKNRSTSDSGNKSTVVGDTYKVGVILPLTGDAASYGEPARNVYEIAIDEINNAGGVDGKKLSLIVEDGKCNGKDAANAVQKLINIDQVQVVLGGFCSSESLAATPVAEGARIALFSAGSSSPDLTNKSKFFFRNYPSDASQGAVMAEVAYSKQNWKKAAVLQEQQDYALGVFKAFDTKFKSLGGEVIKEEFPKDATDFRSQLTKLRAANPDVLFVDTQTPAAAQRVLKQLQDLQWQPKIMINDVTTSDQETLTAFKNLLEGALGAEFSTDPSNAKLQSLGAAYKSKHNQELPFASYASTEYDAVYMIKDAIMAVGYDGQKIAEWGRTVKNWPGASGSVTIGSDGDRVGGHTPKIIKSGKAETYQ